MEGGGEGVEDLFSLAFRGEPPGEGDCMLDLGPLNFATSA